MNPIDTLSVNGMTVHSHDNPGELAIDIFFDGITEDARNLRGNKFLNVVVPTGETFRKYWGRAFLRHYTNHLSLRVNWHHMDEYMAPDSQDKLIDPAHPGSFASYWKECVEDRLSDKLKHAFNRGRFWPSLTHRTPRSFDFVLGGIGRNGHLAFNEPGSGFRSKTRVVRLSSSTMTANNPGGVPFGDNPPTRAITLGLGVIAKGKNVIIAASGPSKTGAVMRAIFDKPSKACPASILQVMAAGGKNVIWVVTPDIFQRIRIKIQRDAAKARGANR